MRVPRRDRALARGRRSSAPPLAAAPLAPDPSCGCRSSARQPALVASQVMASPPDHGDPFPLPIGIDCRSFEKTAGMPRYLVRRRRRAAGRERRVEEAAATLNRLASAPAEGPRPSLPHHVRLTTS